MRTTRPFRIVIAVTLMMGIAYAVSTDVTPPQAATENSTDTRSDRAVEKRSARRVAKLSKKLGKATANGGIPIFKRTPNHARSANTTRTQQAAHNHAVLATEGVSRPNLSEVKKSAAIARRATQPAVSSTTIARAELPSSSALLNNTRHRGPSPAVIDGRNFRAASAGGISGSRISRKPQ